VIRTSIRLAIALVLMLRAAPFAWAQDDDPATLKLAEPDFTLVALPTNLRVPTFKSAFRVTHRFTRALGQGDFASLVEDLFGLDASAQIGLEFRVGIVRNGQVGIHRTSDRTIEFFGQYSLLRQDAGMPVDVSALATIDGTNNFRDSYSPAFGAIVSRTIGEVAGLYVEPIWVNNTNPLPSEVIDDNSTFIVGIGGRVRIRPTVYVVGEFVPSAGFAPGDPQASFAIEKRWGGHTFQLNFSNAFGTTMGQIARGASTNDDWYLGFNISRKFF
jgi:hypothetical protein